MGIIYDEGVNEREESVIVWRDLVRIIIYFGLPAGPRLMLVSCFAFPHPLTQTRAQKLSLLRKAELQITFS